MSEERKPLVSHIFTADPAAHVFGGRIYIYPSHDIPHDGEDNDNGDEYLMEDYHVLSMDGPGGDVTDHGEALHMKNVPWVSKQMWAPDAAEKDGKYYLYFPARDKDGIFRVGVAVGDDPAGPFIPEDSWIPGSYSIDPSVLVDDDGRAYMYNGGLWGGQLEMWQTGHFDENTPRPEGKEPALGPLFAEMNPDMKTYKNPPVHVQILDEQGNPITAEDEDRRYFEGPWVHKYNGKYYLSYSTGTTHYVVYAIGDRPEGPFTYAGRILEPVLGWTTQHAIIEYQGKWYIFYHDCELSGGINHRRCVKYTELTYRSDGTIVTIDPYGV